MQYQRIYSPKDKVCNSRRSADVEFAASLWQKRTRWMSVRWHFTSAAVVINSPKFYDVDGSDRCGVGEGHAASRWDGLVTARLLLVKCCPRASQENPLFTTADRIKDTPLKKIATTVCIDLFLSCHQLLISSARVHSLYIPYYYYGRPPAFVRAVLQLVARSARSFEIHFRPRHADRHLPLYSWFPHDEFR